MTAGKPSGRDAARADADRERGDQEPDARIGKVQRFDANQDDRHLKEAAEEPEIRYAGDGEAQCAVAPDVPGPGPDFGEGIPAHRQGRAGGGDLANEDADERAEEGDGEQRGAQHERLVFPAREQERADAGA